MSQEAQAPGFDHWRLQSWLRIRPEALPKVYSEILAGVEITSLFYWLQIFFAAGIATFGLVENSPAVIIGAMLVSPVMGPIMATGLALAAGDPYLGVKAIVNLLASVTVSIGFSSLVVWLLPFHSATSEIMARTNPNLLDLGIALLSGLAGSVVASRGTVAGATAIPGVAIAVALMPPLCTIGFGLGAGVNLEIMGGAALLFLTNLVAIVASAFLVFFLVGMSSPAIHRAVWASSKVPAARVLAVAGRLRWRVVMLAILLAAIAIPLRRAFLEVAAETTVRAAVQDELKQLVPPDALLSQQVSVDDAEVAIHVISTTRVPESRLNEARENLIRQTGRNVQLSVEAVASKSDLAELMRRVARPAPEPPAERTLAVMQKELVDRVQSAIQQIWPSSDAPIRDFNVQLSPAGVTVDVRYQGTVDLGDIPLNMVRQSLRTSLGIPDLALNVERVR
jgi:uncharacterized hydrophobic protein (TIGR00271 family)